MTETEHVYTFLTLKFRNSNA